MLCATYAGGAATGVGLSLRRSQVDGATASSSLLPRFSLLLKAGEGHRRFKARTHRAVPPWLLLAFAALGHCFDGTGLTGSNFSNWLTSGS
jgi:hypothetical protein